RRTKVRRSRPFTTGRLSTGVKDLDTGAGPSGPAPTHLWGLGARGERQLLLGRVLDRLGSKLGQAFVLGEHGGHVLADGCVALALGACPDGITDAPVRTRDEEITIALVRA